MDEIKINILELASELAHIELVNNFRGSVYESETDGITTYTDEAQDVFNDLYDKYYSLIEQFKIS